MTTSRGKDEGTGSKKGDDERARRLAEQLRANLARRKAQARSRRGGKADERPEGLQSDTKDENG